MVNEAKNIFFNSEENIRPMITDPPEVNVSRLLDVLLGKFNQLNFDDVFIINVIIT
jgi:hypothetical protein